MRKEEEAGSVSENDLSTNDVANLKRHFLPVVICGQAMRRSDETGCVSLWEREESQRDL